MADLPTERDFEDYAAWTGRDVLASGGERLGAVEVIFLDEATDLPEWVLVRLEEAGGSAFVPLAGANVEEQAIRVDLDRERIAAAPQIDADQTLTVAEERRLYEHYGLAYSQEESSTVLPEGATPSDAGATAPQPTEAPPADERPRLRRYSAAAPQPADSASEAEERGPAPADSPSERGLESAPPEQTPEPEAEATPSPVPSNGPTTTGTGVADPAPTPIPPPAPTPIPSEGGFQREAPAAEQESQGPVAALKRRPAIPAAIAGAIAGLIAVLAIRRRR